MSGGSIITPREHWRKIRHEAATLSQQSKAKDETSSATGIAQTQDLLRVQLSLQAAYIESLKSTIADYQKNQIEMEALIKKKRLEN